MAAKRKTTNAKILGKLTDIAARHDTKLALDYQSIKRLEKDTDKVTKNVGSLSETVATLSGTVKTQAGVVNSVLAVTVLAFLGFIVSSVLKPAPDPSIFAESFISVIRAEVNRQVPNGRPHASAGDTAESSRP